MKRFQELRYEKLGLKLFQRANPFSFERAQIVIALADEKERLASDYPPIEGWARQDAMVAIDRILQHLRHGDYEVVMPTLQEKRQIQDDGIALHHSVMELVAECLDRAAGFAMTSPYKWSNLADSIRNKIIFIVKTN